MMMSGIAHHTGLRGAGASETGGLGKYILALQSPRQNRAANPCSAGTAHYIGEKNLIKFFNY